MDEASSKGEKSPAGKENNAIKKEENQVAVTEGEARLETKQSKQPKQNGKLVARKKTVCGPTAKNTAKKETQFVKKNAQAVSTGNAVVKKKKQSDQNVVCARTKSKTQPVQSENVTAKKNMRPEQNENTVAKKKTQPVVKTNQSSLREKTTAKVTRLVRKERPTEVGKQPSRKDKPVEMGKQPPQKDQQLANKEKLSSNGSQGTAKKIHSDALDAWSFMKPKHSSENVNVIADPKPIRSQVEAHSEVYNMNHKRAGVAIIFNHMTFRTMAKRGGSEKDAYDLATTLDKLHFEVRIYNDPTTKQIFTVLETTAAEDHTDADCLVVVAMSHGESGLLHSYENQYPVDILWTSFIGEQCPTLVGKPKLFFIQACRGTQLDNGMQIVHETDSVDAYTIPAHADIMVAYSTYDGFYSWRNPDTGSWFIQALCEELNENWRTHDLLRIMTSVIRRVAIDYQSFVPHNQKMNRKKQIPSIVSMLTRLVYFADKSIE